MPERPTDECWSWQGALDNLGRARFKVASFRYIAARVAYYLMYDDDPGDLKVLHTCDNPVCVNPEHLWLGSQTENVADMNAKGRHGRTGAKGNAQPAAKLTPSLVKLIRESSKGPTEIARELGISQSLASMVRLRQVWKHVE